MPKQSKPHFSLPFRMGSTGTTAAINEQNAVGEISDCCLAILSYPKGYRLELPEFGLPDQTFRQGGASMQDIQNAIQAWEPRAEALAEADPAFLYELVSRIGIQISPEGGEEG